MKASDKLIIKLPVSSWVKALSEGATVNQSSSRSSKALKKEFHERKKVRTGGL